MVVGWLVAIVRLRVEQVEDKFVVFWIVCMYVVFRANATLRSKNIKEKKLEILLNLSK